jgi:hypothetical protein
MAGAEPDDGAEPEDGAGVEPSSATGVGRRPGRLADDIGRRRAYQPASSIHVEQDVRAFLRRRDGAATIESVVRHLDLQFGPGLGRGLVESLQRRGVVKIVRLPEQPQQVQVCLLEPRSGEPGAPDGG